MQTQSNNSWMITYNEVKNNTAAFISFIEVCEKMSFRLPFCQHLHTFMSTQHKARFINSPSLRMSTFLNIRYIYDFIERQHSKLNIQAFLWVPSIPSLPLNQSDSPFRAGRKRIYFQPSLIKACFKSWLH